MPFGLDERENTPLGEMPDEFPDWDVMLADGTVSANIAACRGTVVIYQWWSWEERRGNATKALQELRARWDYIEVIDACNEDYWRLMLKRGLIDEMDGETLDNS